VKITFDTVKSRLSSLVEDVTLESISSTLDNIIKGVLDNIEGLFKWSYEAWKAIGNILVIAILWGAGKAITKLPKGFVRLLNKAWDILKWKNKPSSISSNMRKDYIFGTEVYKNV